MVVHNMVHSQGGEGFDHVMVSPHLVADPGDDYQAGVDPHCHQDEKVDGCKNVVFGLPKTGSGENITHVNRVKSNAAQAQKVSHEGR